MCFRKLFPSGIKQKCLHAGYETHFNEISEVNSWLYAESSLQINKPAKSLKYKWKRYKSSTLKTWLYSVRGALPTSFTYILMMIFHVCLFSHQYKYLLKLSSLAMGILANSSFAVVTSKMLFTNLKSKKSLGLGVTFLSLIFWFFSISPLVFFQNRIHFL